VTNEYSCPYCKRTSLSPGGIKFHVKLTHTDKLAEFEKNVFPQMEAEFKRMNPDQ
jgi:hypothetical protein